MLDQIYLEGCQVLRELDHIAKGLEECRKGECPSPGDLLLQELKLQKTRKKLKKIILPLSAHVSEKSEAPKCS